MGSCPGLLYGGCHGDDEKAVFAELCDIVSDAVPEAFRERAEYVLIRLHLRNDERIMRQRREWYCMYQRGDLTRDGLERMAPLIAAAIGRAGPGRPAGARRTASR